MFISKGYIAATYVLVDHLIIQDLIFLVILVILSAFQEDVFDPFVTFCLAAVQVVQTALDEQLVQVHFEGSSFQDVLS